MNDLLMLDVKHVRFLCQASPTDTLLQITWGKSVSQLMKEWSKQPPQEEKMRLWFLCTRIERMVMQSPKACSKRTKWTLGKVTIFQSQTVFSKMANENQKFSSTIFDFCLISMSVVCKGSYTMMVVCNPIR